MRGLATTTGRLAVACLPPPLPDDLFRDEPTSTQGQHRTSTDSGKLVKLETSRKSPLRTSARRTYPNQEVDVRDNCFRGRGRFRRTNVRSHVVSRHTRVRGSLTVGVLDRDDKLIGLHLPRTATAQRKARDTRAAFINSHRAQPGVHKVHQPHRANARFLQQVHCSV